MSKGEAERSERVGNWADWEHPEASFLSNYREEAGFLLKV